MENRIRAEQEDAIAALVERLEAFLKVAEGKGQFRSIRPSASRLLDDQIERQLPSVRKICNAAESGLGDFKHTSWSGFEPVRRAARVAIGILQDRVHVDAELRAAGLRTEPALELHPRVWESAKSLWHSGQLAGAIGASWKAINADLQQRTGRPDLSDNRLAQQAFGLDATQQIRLHLPGDTSTETWRSRQTGLLHLAQAAVAGFRNPAFHEADHDPDYSRAVEQLASLSLLSHWIDETELTVPNDEET